MQGISDVCLQDLSDCAKLTHLHLRENVAITSLGLLTLSFHRHGMCYIERQGCELLRSEDVCKCREMLERHGLHIEIVVKPCYEVDFRQAG